MLVWEIAGEHKKLTLAPEFQYRLLNIKVVETRVEAVSCAAPEWVSVYSHTFFYKNRFNRSKKKKKTFSACFPLSWPRNEEWHRRHRKEKPHGNLAFWKKLSKLQVQWCWREIWLDNHDTGGNALCCLFRAAAPPEGQKRPGGTSVKHKSMTAS